MSAPRCSLCGQPVHGDRTEHDCCRRVLTAGGSHCEACRTSRILNAQQARRQKANQR